VRFVRSTRSESRRNLAELEPELRTRILALDEPVACDDWHDVVKRSRTSLVRPVWFALGASAAILVAAAGAVLALALSPGLGGAGREQGAGPGRLAREATDVQTIDSLHLTDGPFVVSLSSGEDGGFCYLSPGHAANCQRKAAPLHVVWGSGRVVGMVSAATISVVRIKFSDGTFVEPPISWIGGKINAGLFLYNIPAGKTVVEVNAYHAGRIRGQATWYSV
jgi:hypothetical protein